MKMTLERLTLWLCRVVSLGPGLESNAQAHLDPRDARLGRVFSQVSRTVAVREIPQPFGPIGDLVGVREPSATRSTLTPGWLVPRGDEWPRTKATGGHQGSDRFAGRHAHKLILKSDLGCFKARIDFQIENNASWLSVWTWRWAPWKHSSGSGGACTPSRQRCVF
jgi:hypothetical protein